LPKEKNPNQSKPVNQYLQISKTLQTRHKLALSFSLLLLVVSSAFWLLFQNELNRSLSEHSDLLGASLAEQTAASVMELVLVNDPLGLNVALSQLVRDNNIVYASVFDVDGKQLASAGQTSLGVRSTGNANLSATLQPGLYVADIIVQDAIAGSIQLELDSSAISSFQSRMRNLFLLVLVISLILVVTTAFALSGDITSPLRALLESITDKTGFLDQPASTNDNNETAQLQMAVDNLLARFEEMEGQLLETGIWQSSGQEDNSEPSRLAASILIIKVVNINTAIEMLHPPTLAKLLREYIFYLNQAAHLYGGKLQRLSGDSLLLCFDSLNCDDKHSINALHCAGLFQSIMNRINNSHRKNGEQVLEFRMAIHSGDVFYAPGLLNAEQDTDSVLGKTVDIAFFLCKQSKPNEVLISDSAWSQARTFEEFSTAGQHEVSMPADNVSFMAYILSDNFAGDIELIGKQCEHILGAGTHSGQ
jgi:class 3 adenylate cyclase/uncharacterized membrane protein affecting hemolysin expression